MRDILYKDIRCVNSRNHDDYKEMYPHNYLWPKLCRHCSGIIFFGSRLLLAGPLITFPVLEKREPWHGQSNDFSKEFDVNVHPR